MAAKNIVILIVCSIIVEVVVSHPSKRHINTDELKMTDEPICSQSTPCGWAVYNKMGRNVEYFMKNRCGCMEGKKCLRREDDISINAFVYRCQTEKS